MAIIALKAWYIEAYQPIRELVKRSQDLRLSRNSLLKSGMRADFLDDIKEVKESPWFARYLEGEQVEFYIEGSGSYVISNIDLLSHEIYFSKQESQSRLEPIIYFSHQREYEQSSKIIVQVLEKLVEDINGRSRIPLSLKLAPHANTTPMKVTDSQLQQIRKSMLFIADTTPVASGLNLLSSPTVCIETGYAIGSKEIGQILILRMERDELKGEEPFDFAKYPQLVCKTGEELEKSLPSVVESLLYRFNLY